ncbi:MAG: hypothetical protein AAB688_01315 [Patescibacteria group bacterium]
MLPDSLTLLKQAWEIYRKRLLVFLGIMAFPFFAPSLLVSVFAGRILGFRTESLTSLSFGILLIVVALIAISFFIHLWSWVALLRAIQGREENIGIKESYRRGWNKIIPYLWVSLLSGFITMVGFVFLFIPGLIFLIWFSFASYVLVCEDKRGWEALMASKEYIRRNWWKVVWRFIFVVLIAWLFFYLLNTISNLISAPGSRSFLSYINYAFLTPMVTIYFFLIYENLKKINSVDSAGSAIQNLELKK